MNALHTLPLLRLTHAEADAMRDAAREAYWQRGHVDPRVGYSAWQAEIDAIKAIEEPDDAP